MVAFFFCVSYFVVVVVAVLCFPAVVVRWFGGAVGSVLYAWALKSLPVKRSCYDLERTMCLSMRAWEPRTLEWSSVDSARESRASPRVLKTDTHRVEALGEYFCKISMSYHLH